MPIQPISSADDENSPHSSASAPEIGIPIAMSCRIRGAVRAGSGELGIIPGSMGTRSFIVRGKGEPESFCSCSHGAGRAMSRGEARRRFTLDDHARATEGIECRKDAGVVDEIPGAYKDVEEVMRNQSDLVDIVHTLRQVVCVKG